MQDRFTGRVAIVTGAGDGIGASVVARLLAEGAKVVAADLTEGGARADVPADRFHAVVADVSAADAAETIVGAALERFGRVDIVVNNAGMSEFRALDVLDDALWDRHFAVNVTAHMRMARRVAPELAKSGRGRIVNVASISALRAVASHAAYSSSKAAVLGLTRALAVELGTDGTTVNAVLPGPVLTTMMRKTITDYPEKEQYLNGLSVLGRMAMPEEIAGTVLFLASDDAAFITGQALIVDGGCMARL